MQPMVELREVTCWLKDPDLGALDSLLASRPLITSLSLAGGPGPRDLYAMIGRSEQLCPFLDIFRPNGFASLRHLSMLLIASMPDNLDDVCELSTILTGLESLEVIFEDGACRDLFLTRLPPMPRLTELQVWTQEVLPTSSARFLAGLPQLRSLKLVRVLAVPHWDDDVKHIARTKRAQAAHTLG
jgi:hypothetical protein